MYEQGAFTEAEQIFRRLAERGDSRAAYYLGRMAEREIGTGGTAVTACDWYERAADADHLQALYELGNCYLHGKGREQNIDTALYLYGMAAEYGQIAAQYRLAQLYASGSGVPKNPERAYIYLFLAFKGDISQDPVLRESLEAELTDAELERARTFAMKLLERQSGRYQPD